MFGTNMRAQTNPCNVSPYFYMGLEFYNVTQAGGEICFLNTCSGQPSSWCCYTIPTNPGGFSWVCLDGNPNCPGDHMQASDFAPSGGNPCMQVSISYDGITEHFTEEYNGGRWTPHWSEDGGDNYFTFEGVRYPDYFISFDTDNNSFYFQTWPFEPITDQQGNTVRCIAPGC